MGYWLVMTLPMFLFNPSPYGRVIDDELVFSSYLSRTATKGGYLIGNTHNEAGILKLGQVHNESY